jgi:hypothetical protein
VVAELGRGEVYAHSPEWVVHGIRSSAGRPPLT